MSVKFIAANLNSSFLQAALSISRRPNFFAVWKEILLVTKLVY